MDVFEITGFRTGVAKDGVNYLEPADSFQNIQNGYIYREVLQSRKGFQQFSTDKVTDGSRIMGIFTYVKSDSTFETLVCSQSYLYTYNEGTNTFDQIPFAGGAAGGFSISDSESYVSGTSYPDSDGNDRFIFCGVGLTDVYFYDGTDVKSWTTVADNPNFVDFVSGVGYSGPFQSARYVMRFGERLNFFYPTLNSQTVPQGVLYTGIRDGTGKGDSFNTSGAGMLLADTSDYLSGVIKHGNSVVMAFNRSPWTLEKTVDPFNPYFIKKIPGVIGTDAPFSVLSWGQEVRSIGKEGIASTDLRYSNRVDNKIPHFTTDEMDPTNFELTYGGFDRLNGQFLWSYKSLNSDPDNIYQDKILVNNYEEETWSVFDGRFSCFGTSKNGQIITLNNVNSVAHPEHPSWARLDTTEETLNKLGVSARVEKTLAGDDNGFVYWLNRGNDDYAYSITNISNATQAVVTVGNHALVAGDPVSINGVSGMLLDGKDINNWDPGDKTEEFIPYIVQSVTATTVTINADASILDTYDSGGIITKVFEFYAETIPLNPYRSEGKQLYVSHIDFLIDTNDGYLDVDLIANEEDSPFKSNVRIRPSATQKRREWITIGVNNEMEFLTIRMRQMNPDLQFRATSFRIYAEPGGDTSG